MDLTEQSQAVDRQAALEERVTQLEGTLERMRAEQRMSLASPERKSELREEEVEAVSVLVTGALHELKNTAMKGLDRRAWGHREAEEIVATGFRRAFTEREEVFEVQRRRWAARDSAVAAKK